MVQTATFTDALLLITQRDSAAPAPALVSEARHGLDWLRRMWNAQTGTLYVQVGRGDGTSKLLGDHDLWRLPGRDRRLSSGPRSPFRLLAHRPVFQAGSGPLSPNLAGRMAAAFGLCAQVYRTTDPQLSADCLQQGEAVYAMADVQAAKLSTAVPNAYYREAEWRDDMELGAAELARALLDGAPQSAGLPVTDPVHYLDLSRNWAHAYMTGPHADQDSLNLYDVAGLAHRELFHAIEQAAASWPGLDNLMAFRKDLVGDLHDQLALGAHLAGKDPFGHANPNGWTGSVAHSLGYALEERYYAEISGDHTYAGLAATQTSWVLGANPWGTSFIVGAGRVFPNCLQHQVANLSYSLNGRGRVLRGAVVSGPDNPSAFGGAGAPDGYRACSRSSFARFDGRGARYRDSVLTSASSEPTDDAAALAIALFSRDGGPAARAQASSPVRRRIHLGKSVRGRPIDAIELGDPNARRKVLVVGCIHGDETAGIAVARRLEAGASAGGVDLWVVDAINPDGAAAHTRQNAHGVDLNRNFPWNWRPLGPKGSQQYAGAHALSEPESRVARALILRLRPAITIWFHQPLGLVDESGGSLAVERQFARLAGLPLRRLTRYPGSAASWQDTRLPHTTAFVVELPGGTPNAAAVSRYARAVTQISGKLQRAR
jgi:hypothetical protein